MKVLARILSLVVLASVVTLYTNCGGDDPKPSSKEKVQIEKLVGSWSLASVTNDGNPRTDFVSVVMTISGTYSSDGQEYPYSFTGTFPNPSPMPKTGDTFIFGSNPESQLIRDIDDFPIGYSLTNSNNNLTITLDNYTGGGFAGGRIEQVTGDWTFNFTRQ